MPACRAVSGENSLTSVTGSSPERVQCARDGLADMRKPYAPLKKQCDGGLIRGIEHRGGYAALPAGRNAERECRKSIDRQRLESQR